LLLKPTWAECTTHLSRATVIDHKFKPLLEFIKSKYQPKSLAKGKLGNHLGRMTLSKMVCVIEKTTAPMTPPKIKSGMYPALIQGMDIECCVDEP